MATYIPNAAQTTEPVESRTVESAALEFRTLKTSVNARIEAVQDDINTEIANRIAGDANLQAQNNAQDVRLTAIENALPFIGEGGLPGTVYVQRLSGTGAQTVFTLNAAPQSNNVVDIYINGLYQNKDTFTVSGADVIFSKAPPAGTNNIEVQVTVTIALGETDASLVTYDGTTVEAQLDAITAGNQTIGGVKTFSSPPVVPNDSFSFAQLQNIPTGTILGRASADTGDVEALTGEQATALLSAASETGIGLVELADAAEAAAGTDGTRALSPLRLRNALAATGSAPIFACRAWVHFNGTGTVAIRASGNVSSITDNGVGDYTVNFATAMADASYAAIGTCNWDNVGANAVDQNVKADDHTTTSVRIRTVGKVNSNYFADNSEVSVAIFR